jgi:hypothetical protein
MLDNKKDILTAIIEIDEVINDSRAIITKTDRNIINRNISSLIKTLRRISFTSSAR